MKAAIEGNYKKGNFVVTAESIIPNLEVLNAYKPLMQQFWSKGLFESLEKRYFSLVNRGADLQGEVFLSPDEQARNYTTYLQVFNAAKFEKAESYFDSMTHFDFKCLLPGLLHVEDRVSMAHGLECRAPFLDHRVVELALGLPLNRKLRLRKGRSKMILKQAFAELLPLEIRTRPKMGFGVPLDRWFRGPLAGELREVLLDPGCRSRELFRIERVTQLINEHTSGSRDHAYRLWSLLMLELWFRRWGVGVQLS